MSAEKKVDLNKDVFNKSQYSNTINTSFEELGVKNIKEEIEEEVSIEEFFELYNSLFYDIPSNGEINSHEFLINQSSNYINFDITQVEIEALRVEISNLRQALLDEQVKNMELETGQTIDTSELAQLREDLNLNETETINTIDGIVNG